MKISVRYLALLLWLLAFACTKPAQKTVQDKPTASTEKQKPPTDNAYLVPIEEEAALVDRERSERPLWVIEPGDYQPERKRDFDLLHTRLDLRPDWQGQQLHGTATLRLRPWFYPQSTLTLDAKGLMIHEIRLNKGDTLSYTYDQRQLQIALPRPYTREETIELRIQYTARPAALMDKDSPYAPLREHGLYFINPTQKTPHKPTQIWTQGQTENNACWFPTLDQPNIKTTQETFITVEDRYQTLSNGKLITTQKNADGTRTDHWKQAQPHAPYLFMLAVGEFAHVQDTWKGKPVSYYVEPEYAPHARAIFGRTPEMLDFFSERFGYAYPWEKYAQIVVRDYISGAMENTTATVHTEEVQRTTQELQDYDWDDMIAHELVHHWFGNLVTCESWANLPLNEAFATYGEFLWNEHKEGIEEARYWWVSQREDYLYEAQLKREALIRYRYIDKEDMFDSHSYAKGALVLHLLRQQAGDAAFFEMIRRYLQQYAFKTAEIHHLRLILEEVTGQDWNWFFDQYFLSPGHPEVSVYSIYQDGQLEVTLSQVQPEDYSPVYRLPLDIRVWVNGKDTTFRRVLDQRQRTFTFSMESLPELTLVDAQYEIIGTLAHQKTMTEYLAQLHYTTDYRHQAEAIEALAPMMAAKDTVARAFLGLLQHHFWAIRAGAAKAFTDYPQASTHYAAIRQRLHSLALHDPDARVRMNAVDALSSFADVSDDFFEERARLDSSFFVKRSGLFALAIRQGNRALPIFAAYESSKNEELVMLLADFYSIFGVPDKTDWFIQKMQRFSGSRLSYLMSYFAAYLPSLSKADKQKAADYLLEQARHNSFYQTRKEAYQHLLFLADDLEGLSQDLQAIRDQERDRRVSEFHQALSLDD
ncbi:MAG: M1 family metallopeptidase [Bernardetiaceae bacterium]